MFTGLLVLTAALVVVPGPQDGIFDGIPLSTAPEAAVVGLLLLMLSKTFRTRIRESLGPWFTRAALPMGALMVVVLIMKVVLLTMGPTGGFRACLKPALPTITKRCATSFDDPLDLSNATRIDEVIDYGSADKSGPPTTLSDSNWRAGFMNDLRLNFFEPEMPTRERIPIQATWVADMSTPTERAVEISYIGEASVSIDGVETDFPSSYDRPGVELITLPSGSVELQIDYLFNDGSTGLEVTDAPYAAISVAEADGQPFRVPAPMIDRVVGVLSDAVIAVLILGFLVGIGSSLRRLGKYAIGASVIGLLALGLPDALILPLGFWVAAAMLATITAVGLELDQDRDGLLLLGVTLIAALVAARELSGIGLETVLYRGGGQDFLTYEGQARAILASGSLQGGEAVFVYSPAFRYILFAMHLMFGDGDVLPAIAGALALTLCGAWLCWTFVGSTTVPAPVARWKDMRRGVANGKKQQRTPKEDPSVVAGAALVGLAVVLLVILCTSEPVATMIRNVMSEYPTWIFLIAAVPLLFAGPSLRDWLAGAALLGLCFILRGEQAIGIALLVTAFLLYWGLEPETGTKTRLLVAVALIAAIGLLPAIHNQIYGDRFAFLPQTPDQPVNFPLPPRKLLHLGDANVRATLANQASGVGYLNPSPSDGSFWPPGALPVAIHGLQVAWLAAVVCAVKWRKRLEGVDWLFLILPLGFLVPHLFIQVFLYYPRHIVAGYIATAISVLWIGQRSANSTLHGS